ncbi:MAG: hypothetical protein LBT36_01870 [Oscillospiraceae bacterium]|nr:hypothetical protein [Oscillospiraceae bacterium]
MLYRTVIADVGCAFVAVGFALLLLRTIVMLCARHRRKEAGETERDAPREISREESFYQTRAEVLVMAACYFGLHDRIMCDAI